MLKFNMAILAMLLFPLMSANKRSTQITWWATTSLILIMTTLSLTLISSNNHFISLWSWTDQLSQPLISLSLLIAALMMLTSTKTLHQQINPNKFIILNMILLLILINCFSASNMLLFYILFEASLIPTMMIIMAWGYQPERVQASMYMMIYTVLASLPMLLIFLIITNYSLSFNMNTMTLFSPNNLNPMFYLFMISGFLVKLPMFSMHLWLPKAHVEAPIAGSMVLAAILLKLGGYGIIRIMMNSLYKTCTISPLLASLSLIGAIITSMICLRQPDLKSLIAYSSVGHMGLLLTGLMSNSSWGINGAILMMIAHGLCSSALFSLANISYEITHTRSLFLMKGMLCFLPTMSMWWFLMVSGNMAAPPSINLLSEIALITAILSMSMYTMMFLIIITFLAGAYSLHMYTSTQHGQISNFTNPSSFVKQKDMIMLLMHLSPLILLILKPEFMTI